MLDVPDIATLADSVRSGTRSATEIAQACLDHIDRWNGPLNAFREVDADSVLADAAAIDARPPATRGPLAGVPIAIKDNIATCRGTTMCGSRILEGYRSPFDATAVARLVAAGAIVLGKTNCDEFAMGSSTETSVAGPVANPWDHDRVPGGSSGGSAAAVAAAMCPAALGSDTGGSIRQPAALTGVVGVKPSYGRVSRYGLVAFGSSLDQIGPITTNVTDAARVLDVMAGPDPRDSTCAGEAWPATADDLEAAPTDLVLGVPRQHLDERTDPRIATCVREAIDRVVRETGARVIDVDLPLTEYAVATYYVIAPAEAASNLARYDGIRYGRRAEVPAGADLDELYARTRGEGFGREVQRRIMLGTYTLSAGYYDAYYLRALKVRRLIKDDLDRTFARCHAIVGPTSPFPAFPRGARKDPLAMYQCDVFTTTANIAGICAASIPCGMIDEAGSELPVGLQIQCPAFGDAALLRIARLFERVLPPSPRPEPARMREAS